MDIPNGKRGNSKLRGVGGWLLLFCVLVTIIGPAASVFIYSAEFARIQENWGGLRLIPTFYLVADVAGLGITAFAVYAGIALWTIKPKAVRKAKAFLIASLAYDAIRELACLSLGTGFLLWSPTPSVESSIGTIVTQSISLVIWFTYLKNSERVKATYGSPDSREATI